MNVFGIICIVAGGLLMFFILTYFFIGELAYLISLKRASFAGQYINKEIEKHWIDRLKIDFSWWDKIKTEKITISSKPSLVGFLKVNNPNKFVIIVHGYMASHKNMQQYAKMFDENKFSILLPDNRGHGESQGKSAGMGWQDKDDILKWINYLIKRFGNDIQIAVFGVSMGGSTVCMLSGLNLPKNVKCLISDSAYDNALNQFKYVSKQRIKVPLKLTIAILNSYSEIRVGYKLQDADAIKQVQKTKIPILFIHGKQDSLVPFFMMENLYNNAPIDKRDKLVIENADHTESMAKDSSLYTKKVLGFINNNFEN